MVSKEIIEVLPATGNRQGEEMFKVIFADGVEKVFHSWDYTSIYSHPDLYERLYCDMLDFSAYKSIGKLLIEYAGEEHNNLRVLDVACGSGLMGKFLVKESPLKIDFILGVDILPEAIQALHRDCADVYKEAMTVEEFQRRSDMNEVNLTA